MPVNQSAYDRAAPAWRNPKRYGGAAPLVWPMPTQDTIEVASNQTYDSTEEIQTAALMYTHLHGQQSLQNCNVCRMRVPYVRFEP